MHNHYAQTLAELGLLGLLLFVGIFAVSALCLLCAFRDGKRHPLLPALAAALLFLKRLSGQIAVSDACDIVTLQVNSAITEIMRQEDYDAEWFVHFEKNESGEITAISRSGIFATKLKSVSEWLCPRSRYRTLVQ